ncbi:hypothetical protein [Streptomyces sp. NBC_01618]|uniref:hypothetical protein n=1 Tax=Streptomyces sp. NBC_01618 TaxID=2975900 RepID=UPI003870478D|nr:hypothetical protein OH735_35290 [Streptomyces sp. NBC_01618]
MVDSRAAASLTLIAPLGAAQHETVHTVLAEEFLVPVETGEALKGLEVRREHPAPR